MVAMAGSGVTAAGPGAGTAACVVGVVVGMATACVVGVVVGVTGVTAATIAGETFLAVAACTAAVAVRRGADVASDRAPPAVLMAMAMATATEARAIATTPTTAPRPRRVRIDLMLPAARSRRDVRPAPEDGAERGSFVRISTMC
jgi:hypothetical protein